VLTTLRRPVPACGRKKATSPATRSLTLFCFLDESQRGLVVRMNPFTVPPQARLGSPFVVRVAGARAWPPLHPDL
jgi:hypothetical protein